MPYPLTPLPGSLGRTFTAAEAGSAGVPPGRLKHDDVRRVSHGIYARVTPTAPARTHPAVCWRDHQLELARLLQERLDSQLFFTGPTAAAIWGLPLRFRVGEMMGEHVSMGCFRPARGPRRDGILVQRLSHRLTRVVECRGVRVTDPATTWAMLAAGLTEDEAVALGDAVIHRSRVPGTSRLKRTPLATIQDLERAASLPYRPAAGKLRALLPLLSPHSASPPETHLRLRLAMWGLPDPELDFDLYGENEVLVGCSEFAYPEFRVAVEYEGDHHLTDRRQWDRDIRKYRQYAQLGWEVIRVTASLLYRHPGELRRQVVETLRRRGWQG